jgi:toxin ParE1/3/4
VREIVFRPQAEADILEIVRYTKAEYGDDQAFRYTADLRRQIEFAAEIPGIGAETHGLPPLYRKVRSGAHRVIYRYDDTSITVVRILHEREDVPDDFDDV